MRERRGAFKARILGIAAGYDPRLERLANRIREAADGLVACAAYPALPATTRRSERRMRTFVKDRYASPMLVSGRGRRRHSDGKTCRETWRDKAVNPVHEMRSILGVEPPREWAQIWTEGERAAPRVAPAGCRVAMPAGRTDHAIARGGGERAPVAAHAVEAVPASPTTTTPGAHAVGAVLEEP